MTDRDPFKALCEPVRVPDEWRGPVVTHAITVVEEKELDDEAMRREAYHRVKNTPIKCWGRIYEDLPPDDRAWAKKRRREATRAFFDRPGGIRPRTTRKEIAMEENAAADHIGDVNEMVQPVSQQRGIYVCPRHDFDIVENPKVGCPKCNAEKAALLDRVNANIQGAIDASLSRQERGLEPVPSGVKASDSKPK